jgi:hypothetical protein
MAIDRTGPFWLSIGERDVDAVLMELLLPFDVSQSPGDQAFFRQSLLLLASA